MLNFICLIFLELIVKKMSNVNKNYKDNYIATYVLYIIFIYYI